MKNYVVLSEWRTAHLTLKGGTVIEYNGSLMHLEMPQVPADHIDDFCSLNTFKYALRIYSATDSSVV